tara:strand:- start:10474 stop:10932 length:459 start_codon:yes stop_codon:yes gene_type:complete
LPSRGIHVEWTNKLNVTAGTIKTRRTGSAKKQDFKNTFGIPWSTQTIIHVYGSKLAMVAMGRAVFANSGVSIINCKVLPLSGLTLHTGGGTGVDIVLSVGAGGAHAGGGGTSGCRIFAGFTLQTGAGVGLGLVFASAAGSAYPCVTTLMQGG